jgi:predicted AlkP superfamily phosphohydrolase/phosphomutase
MPEKLLLIGIDALDAELVDQFSADLPTITQLRKDGYYAKISSVWPPDSETAWASIYTGWNPARHGIFQFVDPLDKASFYLSTERDNRIFQGQTFWDMVGDAGYRVCILFPHVGYPSWPVNGIMVTRAAQEQDVSTFPPNLEKQYNFAGLQGVKGLAGRDRQAYLDAIRQLLERQLEFNLQMMRAEEWDLFFTYWSALDLIQHQFWSYCDPHDPTFVDGNPFTNVIKEFYILHDQIVGRLISEVGPDTHILVLSDHGHGMRPVKIFNINRLLLDNGFLHLKSNALNRRAMILKKLRHRLTNFVSKHELGGFASMVLKLAPWTKQVYLSTVNLDLEKTVAYITDMSGIKAYAYGGIQIARQNLNGLSYPAIREAIIGLLMDAEDPKLGDDAIVKWAKPREALYSGPFINEYPDIIFELRPDYGAGWDATGPLFDVSPSHNLYPGSHIGSNTVFIYSGPQYEHIRGSPHSLMDIAPTILDLFGILQHGGLDGKSILAPQKVLSR